MDKIAFARLIAAIQNLIDIRNGSMGIPDIEYIEALARPLAAPEASPTKASASEVNNLLFHMINDTHKIEAIKAYRTLTGESLKESKDAVERYWVRQPVIADASHVRMIEDNYRQRLMKEMLAHFSNYDSLRINRLIEEFERSATLGDILKKATE